MKAEDTVIKYQCKHQVTTGSSEWHMIDGYNMGAGAQAKISFKLRTADILKQLHNFNQRGLTITEAIALLK